MRSCACAKQKCVVPHSCARMRVPLCSFWMRLFLFLFDYDLSAPAAM